MFAQPPTYKNLPTTQLHQPQQFISRFIFHSLCYVNYPNPKNAASIYAKEEHEKFYAGGLARLPGSRGCSSSPKLANLKTPWFGNILGIVGLIELDWGVKRG